MKLIDKDTVVAEIERRINNIIRTPEEEAEVKRDSPDQYGIILGYRAALSILDDVEASKRCFYSRCPMAEVADEEGRPADARQ